jgi:hypothetical protein
LPFPKAHGKVLYRVKMRREPFAVRLGKMRTAKAVPCVFLGARQRRRGGSVVDVVLIGKVRVFFSFFTLEILACLPSASAQLKKVCQTSVGVKKD